MIKSYCEKLKLVWSDKEFDPVNLKEMIEGYFREEFMIIIKNNSFGVICKDET